MNRNPFRIVRAGAGVVLLAAALTLTSPSSLVPAQAADGTVIRVATLSPRNSPFVRDLLKLDKDLRAASNGQVGVKVYPSGVAGDEKDVIRKMRVGQMDAAAMTTTGLAQISRAVAVLNAPGVVVNNKQMKAVQQEMLAEWDKAFYDDGFKLVGWGTAGQYRYFSKAPITHPDDVKRLRPWVWPESYTMVEMWKAVGATGVPLGVPEVYGALQTGMIDTVISTCLALTALQWHTKLDHMTAKPHGVLLLGMVVAKNKWDSLPEKAQEVLLEVARRNADRGDADSIRNDARAFEMLKKRGFTAVEASPEGQKAWETMFATVRKRLTGRVFPDDLLKRVQAVADKAK